MTDARATPLPDWAVRPLTMDEAAAALGVSRRTLVDFLRRHPHYERRGRRRFSTPST